jgi:hypothetical protein
MPVPIGLMFFWLLSKNVKVRGSTVVGTRCQQCGEKYHYQLKRAAWGQNPSKTMAREMAQKQLRGKLRNDIDPVPCPDCGWFQEEMVLLLRERRLRWLRALGIACVALGMALGLGVAIWAQEQLVSPTVATLLAALAIAVVPLLGGAAFLLLRHFDNARYDPNDPETEQERIELGRCRTVTKEKAAEMIELMWDE